MATVRDLFAEMGFEEPELSVRTRVFVVAHSFDDALSIPLSDKEVSSQLDTRFEFFTRR
jgi:hypothetical protein